MNTTMKEWELWGENNTQTNSKWKQKQLEEKHSKKHQTKAKTLMVMRGP